MIPTYTKVAFKRVKMLSQLVRRSAVFSARRLLSAAAATTPAAAAPIHKVDKESLMNLRKRTGYSFVNCRKALEKFGPEKMADAEEWLKDLAQKEGWAKAAKLSSRATTQGLVGVATDGQFAAAVELTCETDFVARGEPFQKLLAELTSAVLLHTTSGAVVFDGPSNRLVSKDLEFDSLTSSDGCSLREILTAGVGSLRENLAARTVRAFRSPQSATLFASSHPKQSMPQSVQAGRFVSLIALRRLSEESGLFPSERLADQICQHVIGMRSETLGSPPEEAKKLEEKKEASKEEDELNDFFSGQTTTVDENETALLRQAFMLNPSQTVHDYLQGHKADVLDFARIQLHGAEEE